MLEDLVEGIKNSHLYLRGRESINQRIEKELSQADSYEAVQEIGKKYINGIRTGAKLTFWGLTAPFSAYFLAGTPLPYVGRLAYLPHADKAGHAAVGMGIGWIVGKLHSKLDDYFHFWEDVDDAAERRNKNTLLRFGLEFVANISAGVGKEVYDKFHGGVASLADAIATIGVGQLINGILEYTRAGKYEIIINQMRKRLRELGLDDDGNALPVEKEYKPIKITISKAHKVRKAIYDGNLSQLS
ncbi:MAG: hypothetical protein J7K73_00365 [Nanoarchaeota archaeon]|nr:hypothetical protein [Nanoarchaeota archaeon]